MDFDLRETRLKLDSAELLRDEAGKKKKSRGRNVGVGQEGKGVRYQCHQRLKP